MCGILFHHRNGYNNGSELFTQLTPLIRERGSDFHAYSNDDSVQMFSSVLSLRSFKEQPCKSHRYTLMFNGELYNEEIRESDTEFFFSSLGQRDIFSVIESLKGEFAYVVHDKQENCIFFGKDSLGKKALCFAEIDGDIFVSSVMPYANTNFQECKGGCVYSFDLETNRLDCMPFRNIYVVGDGEMLDPLVLGSMLKRSVEDRVTKIQPLIHNQSDYAILFSGGLDCTLLAGVAASLGPSRIDLINVAFHNHRSNTLPCNTPDRKLSLASWINLQEKFPQVIFQMVEVDVEYHEYLEHREKIIQLIYPNNTEMDLSIASAFYFASRGKGSMVEYDSTKLLNEMHRKEFTSKCKVLLSGLGADELFGGYTRHERIFRLKEDSHTLYALLKKELQHDLDNLYVRNLSRDDKVISCWSKEVRYPFLDHDFVEFATQSVPLKMKLHFKDELLTRKYILRQLAEALDLNFVANEPKRAIQFGAKSAKLEVGSGRMKGTDQL